MDDDCLFFRTFIEEEQSFFTARQYTATTTDTTTTTTATATTNASRHESTIQLSLSYDTGLIIMTYTNY